MGLIIITASDADTVALAEVARRFGAKVDFRFGDCEFVDNAVGTIEIVPTPAVYQATKRLGEGFQNQHKNGSRKNKDLRKIHKRT